MSGNQSERSPSDAYRTADEIVRSILDDNASASSDISPSGELYRAIERFHANAHRRPGLVNSARRDLVRSHLSRWAAASASASTSTSASATVSRSPSRNSMSSEASHPNNSDTRRRLSREPQTTTATAAPSLPPLRSLNTSRRSSTMSTSGSSNAAGRPSRSRYNPDRSHETAPSSRHSLSLMQLMWLEQQPNRRLDAMRERQQLGEIFSERQAEDDHNGQQTYGMGFAYPPSQPYSELSFPSPPLQSHESTEESRRAKRRKLDSDRLSSGFRGFRYGKFGQVEPGPLTMEIMSCDGGTYPDNGHHSYAAENILKNDASVYCTKGPRCNIVLRHQGATVFTLKELIIKAPRSNYTSPVQEGMVFISMNSDSLLDRTAKYQIQYLPSTRSSRLAERATQPLAPIMSIRHNEDGTMTRAQVRARRLYNIGLDDEDNDYRVAQIPSEFTASPPPFHVTTECSDDEADDAIPRSDWQAPNRIGSLPFESDSSDEGGNLPELIMTTRLTARRRYRDDELSQLLQDQSASPEPPQPSGGDLMAPHARFFIESDKSKCTIRFDPPVSGRYILLKMWSPHRDLTGNIDIQAVIARGFAGPRYFPAVELR